jgi:hypothetical protein
MSKDVLTVVKLKRGADDPLFIKDVLSKIK